MSNARVGQIFQDRYMILQELGAGGMGTVYRARQLDAEREVALKLLHNDAVNDEQSIARFHREFKLLSKLSHQNIMTVYGLAMDDHSMPYAVCEFLEGKSLRKVLAKEGKLPWQRACKICIQIARAMQFAHEQGIVHRDLKPENVMLQDLPEPDFVKLVDFGLSTAIEEAINDSQKLTRTGQVIGSAFYMSPEQMRKKADARSDIYALACLLFELLCGSFLFDAESSAEAIHQHQSTDADTRFPSINQPIPKALFELLSRMLKKDPESRLQTMSEVQIVLQTCLDKPENLITGSQYSAACKTAKAPVWIIPAILALVIAVASVLIYSKKENLNAAGKENANKSLGNTFTRDKRSRINQEYERIMKSREQAPVKCVQLSALAERYYPVPVDLARKINKSAYELIKAFRLSRPELFYKVSADYATAVNEQNPEEALRVAQPILQADEKNPPKGLKANDIITMKGFSAKFYEQAGDNDTALKLAKQVADWEFGAGEAPSCAALGVLINANDTKTAQKLIKRTARAGYILNAEEFCRNRGRYDLADFCMNYLKDLTKLGNYDSFFEKEKYRMIIEQCRLYQVEKHPEKAKQLIPDLLKDNDIANELRTKEPECADLAIALKYAGMTEEALKLARDFRNPSGLAMLVQADLLTMKKRFSEARKKLLAIRALRIESGSDEPDVEIFDPETGESRTAISRLDDIEAGKADYNYGLEDWNNHIVKTKRPSGKNKP